MLASPYSNNKTHGFPGGSDDKESACNAGDPGSIPGSGRSPGEGNGDSLQYSSREFHGQRSLMAYSPWGLKEADTTERLIFSLYSNNSKIHISKYV